MMVRRLRLLSTWPRLLLASLAAAALVLVVFTVIERTWLADAGADFLTNWRLARGVTAAALVVTISVAAAHAQNADLRQREAQWLGFLDGLPVAVFALDAQGRPAFANEPAKRMLGAGILPGVATEELSTVYPSFVAGTDTPYPPERMPIVRALAEKKRSIVSDVELERDGERIPIEAWASPVLDAEGQVRFSIAVFFDIGDRIRAEKERDRRLAQELELEQERRFGELQRQFINHAAHQLYTPLTPLKLQIHRLQAGRVEDALPIIERSVDRLHDLITQVLHVARTGARHVGEELTSNKVSDLCRDACARMAPLADERGVDLKLGEAEVDLTCGPEQVTEALANLVHNGIRFSPNGGSVELTARRDGQEVVITVADKGKGWPAGMVRDADIFGAFKQGPDVADVKEAGWGLGLFVANSVAVTHGGTLSATSPGAGQGATFELRLPAHR